MSLLLPRLHDLASVAPRVALFTRDASLIETFADAMSRLGGMVDRCARPSKVVEQVRAQLCDIAVVEIEPGDSEAFSSCVGLRLSPDTASFPIIVIGENLEEPDRLRAYEAGADLVLQSPISVKELVVRIQGIFRRLEGSHVGGKIKSGSIAIDLTNHKVSCCGSVVHLQPIELRLLTFLMKQPARVFSRQEIIRGVYRGGNPEPRTIDVYVRRLRQSLRCMDKCDPIRTVPGAGYALESERCLSR